MGFIETKWVKPRSNGMEQHTYWSLRQIVESGKYPFSMGQLRHYLLRRHRNGLEKAVRRIGKRLVIRTDLFQDWVESQSTQSSRKK
jgi:hypothetical protein